jgi:2-hydroxy-3-oxopropionate reductase
LLLDLLKDSAAASKMVDVRGPLMVSHRFDAQMKIDLFLKDFKLMLEEGRRLGVALPLTSITQQLATAAAAAGRGKEDLAAVVTTLERLGGLKEDRLAAKRGAARSSIASKRRHRQ